LDFVISLRQRHGGTSKKKNEAKQDRSLSGSFMKTCG
jgi:hypothetical protein